jgi:hypothetical protein
LEPTKRLSAKEILNQEFVTIKMEKELISSIFSKKKRDSTTKIDLYFDNKHNLNENNLTIPSFYNEQKIKKTIEKIFKNHGGIEININQMILPYENNISNFSEEYMENFKEIMFKNMNINYLSNDPQISFAKFLSYYQNIPGERDFNSDRIGYFKKYSFNNFLNENEFNLIFFKKYFSFDIVNIGKKKY